MARARKEFCKHGHPRTPENVSANGTCKTCTAIAARDWGIRNKDRVNECERLRYNLNPEKYRNKSKKTRLKNLDAVRERERLSYAADPQRAQERFKRYRDKYPDKIKSIGAAWRANNKHKKAAQQQKRKAAKIKRTPTWLTKDQLLIIEGFYIWAHKMTEMTGIKHHVDHIVPLQGRTVSGLHVPWNLQILTAAENISKHNNFVPGRVTA